MIGDRAEVIREPFEVDLKVNDQKPHGFSGFGVSDSGGQQWASSGSPAPESSTVPESATATERRETHDAEAA